MTKLKVYISKYPNGNYGISEAPEGEYVVAEKEIEFEEIKDPPEELFDELERHKDLNKLRKQTAEEAWEAGQQWYYEDLHLIEVKAPNKEQYLKQFDE